MPDQKPTLEYGSRKGGSHRVAPWLLLVTIPALHVLAIFFLYRGRVLGQPFCNSDEIVFYLPTMLAFAAYVAVLIWMKTSAGWVIAAVLISLVATFLSFWLAMVVSLNTYGS